MGVVGCKEEEEEEAVGAARGGVDADEVSIFSA